MQMRLRQWNLARRAPAVDVEGVEDGVELVVVCEEAEGADGLAELLLRDRSVVVLVPAYVG